MGGSSVQIWIWNPKERIILFKGLPQRVPGLHVEKHSSRVYNAVVLMVPPPHWPHVFLHVNHCIRDRESNRRQIDLLRQTRLHRHAARRSETSQRSITRPAVSTRVKRQRWWWMWTCAHTHTHTDGTGNEKSNLLLQFLAVGGALARIHPYSFIHVVSLASSFPLMPLWARTLLCCCCCCLFVCWCTAGAAAEWLQLDLGGFWNSKPVSSFFILTLYLVPCSCLGLSVCQWMKQCWGSGCGFIE